jgi:hypothetical protein
VRSHGKVSQFDRYWEAIQRDLRALGVGVEAQQLSTYVIGSSAWGRLSEKHPVSHLGIVRPVTTKGFPEDLLYVYDLFEDKVYR